MQGLAFLACILSQPAAFKLVGPSRLHLSVVLDVRLTKLCPSRGHQFHIATQQRIAGHRTERVGEVFTVQ